MSGPLSEQQFAEIAERVLAATPGPWEQYPDYGPNFYANVRGEMLLPVGSIEFGDGESADADRALIEHAAEDMAALLAEVERLAAERHTTNEALSKAAEAIRAKDQRIAELEKAAVEARAALGSLCSDLEDPGTAALGALYLISQATTWTETGADFAAIALARRDAETVRWAAEELEGTDPDEDAVNVLYTLACDIEHGSKTAKTGGVS